MPERIQIGGNTIEYVYDASGVKQSVKHTPVKGDAVTRSYSGNKVYENGNLKMILTEEGYVEKEGNSFNRYYYLKDHLGNNRVVLDASGNIVQSTEYYPFGAHYTKSTSQEKQPYKFGGKELDHLFDLDCYDFEARMYDPVLSRFMTMDPLAEKYYSISPYAYCLNNPVKYVDPDGRKIVITVGKYNLQYNFGIITETSSGRGVKYSADSHLGKVVNAYNKALFSSDLGLARQVVDLMSSDNIHEVVGTQESVNAVEGGVPERVSEANKKIEAGIGVGTKTRFNFSEETLKELTESTGTEQTPFTVVVHELQHQSDFDKGNMKDLIIPSSSKSPQEIRTVNNENKAHRIEGHKNRTIYGGDEIDPKKIKNP